MTNEEKRWCGVTTYFCEELDLCCKECPLRNKTVGDLITCWRFVPKNEEQKQQLIDVELKLLKKLGYKQYMGELMGMVITLDDDTRIDGEEFFADYTPFGEVEL